MRIRKSRIASPTFATWRSALKPTGRIGIVNWKPGRGGPGPDESNERVERSVVEADAAAAGLRVLASENLPYQYLLVLAPVVGSR